MIKLILYFGWDYILTISSNGLYGQPGIKEFHDLADPKGACIYLNKGIDDSSDYVLLTNNQCCGNYLKNVIDYNHHYVCF